MLHLWPTAFLPKSVQLLFVCSTVFLHDPTGGVSSVKPTGYRVTHALRLVGAQVRTI